MSGRYFYRFFCQIFLFFALFLGGNFCFAQPPNDACANAETISFGAGEFGTGTYSRSVTFGAATKEAGEWFTQVNRLSDNDKQSVWYRFRLPTARKVKISSTSPAAPAGDVGLTLYKSAGCQPDSANWVASGLPSIATLGEIFDVNGCVQSGDYLLQVSAAAGVNGAVNLSFVISTPTFANDLPAQAFDFGTVSGLSITQTLDAGCLTIQDASETCPALGAHFTQTAWSVFTTDGFIDQLDIIAGNPFFDGGADTIGYRIYEGNALTSPVSSLNMVYDCRSIVQTAVNPSQNSYFCNAFEPNKTYTIQWFFSGETFDVFKIQLKETGLQPTNAAFPPNIPPTYQLGTLLDGQPKSVTDYIACNANMALNLCGAIVPPFAVVGADTFRYNTWVTFDIPATGVLDVSLSDPFAVAQLYEGDAKTSCNLTPVNSLGEIGVKPICELSPKTYSLQILSKNPGINLTTSIVFRLQVGFADPANPNDLGIVTGTTNGLPAIVPCEDDTLVGGIGDVGILDGTINPNPNNCYKIKCGGSDYWACKRLFKLCDKNFYNRFIYRQFQLVDTAQIEIKNVQGNLPFVLIQGKVSDMTNFPLFARSSCTYYYRSNPCEPTPPGWYTVVSFGTSQDQGTPTNVQVGIIPPQPLPAPQFNRPHKASNVNSGQPINWFLTGMPDAPKSQNIFLFTPEKFDCKVDTPYVDNLVFPCCPYNVFSRSAYYVFTITKESYLRVAVSQGDTNIYTKLYNVDVRTDSLLLADPSHQIQPCNRCGITEFCRLQPGTYTLVVFVNQLLAGLGVQPIVQLDRSLVSLHDHALSAYDFGVLPPNQTVLGERDYFSCTTGAQPDDPPFDPTGLAGACKTGFSNPNGANVPYPTPANRFVEPFWITDAPAQCKDYSPRKTLWYTFQTFGAGKVTVRVKNKTPGVLFNCPFSIYKANQTDGTIDFDQLVASGLVDSTTNQGLVFVKNNDLGNCAIVDSLVFTKSECEPARYFLIIENATVNSLTHQIEPSITYNPNGVSAGDFCQNAIEMAVAVGTADGTVTVNCHTIGEGFGENGDNLGCLYGPEGFVSSWFHLNVVNNQKMDLTFQMAESTNASSSDIRYRVLYGSCNALTPGECVSSFTSGFTLRCMPGIDYYVQVVGPKGYEGNLDLRVFAEPSADQNCPNELPLVKAAFDFANDCGSPTFNFQNQSTAGAAIQYLWTIDGDTTAQTSPVFVFPPTDKVDSFVVKLLVIYTETGLRDSVTQTVVVYPPAGTQSVEGESVFCAGETVVLSAPEGYESYRWNTGETLPFVVVSDSGNYYVDLTFGKDCFERLKHRVDKVDPGALSAGSALVCPGLPVRLEVTPTVAGGEALWFLAGTDSLVFRGVVYETPSISQPLAFDVVYTFQGCTLQTPVRLTAALNPAPVAQFTHSPNPAYFPVGSVAFKNQTTFPNPAALNYFWDFGDTTFSSEQNPVHDYRRWGDFTVTLVAQDPVNGCADTFVVSPVRVLLRDSLYIPNVFTPDANDGFNDVFEIYTYGIDRYELDVYDRWGNRVFDNGGKLDNFWNGRRFNKGGLCASGVYYYTVKFYRPYGKIFERTGEVTLLRQ